MSSRQFRRLFSLNLLFIIIASLIPSSIPSFWHLDKAGHFAAYASLFTLALFAFQQTKTRIAIFLLSLGLGIILEWLQTFVPGREKSLPDALTNAAGLLFGIFVYHSLSTFVERQIK